jgi:carbamoyltransferase
MRKIVSLLDDGAFALDLAYFRHHKEKIGYEWSGGRTRGAVGAGPAERRAAGAARRSLAGTVDIGGDKI